MIFDFDLIQRSYSSFNDKVSKARNVLNHPLTFTEKVLYAHLFDQTEIAAFRRGADYVNFAPDRVAMQDATAQMALLQFMNAGKARTAVPSSVHCDHLIQAQSGASADLAVANDKNKAVYEFLKSVSDKYGIGFWKPGAGIIHQIVLENYAFPGGMIIGTDSHTVNAGGLGMISIGVGGADAVDVMAGMAWELKMPKLIGIKLTGKLNGWTSAKDVILKVAGLLTAKGGTNAIIEYFGEGAESLSCTGKATICNMGAEVGATTSIFAYDASMKRYLQSTGRADVAALADKVDLKADAEVYAHPEKYFDQLFEINLSELEPHINGPLTPDAATPISAFKTRAQAEGWPLELSVGLIGSCTNSSYEDLSRSASLVKQAEAKGLKVKSEYIVTPGSDLIYDTATRDGLLGAFTAVGGVVMANACGPCIGQWTRANKEPEKKNSIITSFNRNFAARNDGNPNTLSFVASPELVTALAIAGRMDFNPLTDTLTNAAGQSVKLDPPTGDELPTRGFAATEGGYQAPATDGSKVQVAIPAGSDRLQALEPFAAWGGTDYTAMPLLIKAKGKCTTDHISMAGAWLKYRGHLQNISDNLLMGAENFFNGKTNTVLNQLDGGYAAVSAVAKAYKEKGIRSMVVAEENYGEGSSREHAAMEPRFLNVGAVLVKSFARIHETNLKKQGMLALTFANKADYDRIRENDRMDILGLTSFAPGKNLVCVLHHADGTSEQFEVCHTFNQQQIEWFKAGGALNLIAAASGKK